MSWVSDIFAGSASGALEGIGKLAVNLRSAITGDMTPADRAKLEELTMQMESAVNIAQTKVNEAEARHQSIFVAGWRPGVGWVCAIGLLYQFVIQPLLTWALSIYRPELPLPPLLDGNSLMSLVMSMLGMAGVRSFDKSKGRG